MQALRLQFPLFDIQSLLVTAEHLAWRKRIKASCGYDPLLCPRCGRTLELVEIWEPKRGYNWMKRWLVTHRLSKAFMDCSSLVLEGFLPVCALLEI
jgi:hypothetical protein